MDDWFWYNNDMDTSRTYTPTGQRLPLSKRSRDAIALQAMEGNAFTDAEIERICDQEDRGLRPDQCRDEIYASLERKYGIRRPA
jgi:hypothetical protein